MRESADTAMALPVGGDRLGRAPQLRLDLGQPQQHRHRGRVELHRLGQHRRRLDRIARVGQLRQRQQPIAPLGERAGGGAAAHHLRQPIVLAPRAKDHLQDLEVGLRLRLDRQHLFQAASGHRVVAHLVGVEPRRLTKGRRRPRRRLGEPRLARVELGGRAPVAGRLAQPGLRAQRRQERRVGLEGAPEVGVGATQIAGRLARAAEIPEQHRAREAVGRRLGQSAAGQDRPAPRRRRARPPVRRPTASRRSRAPRRHGSRAPASRAAAVRRRRARVRGPPPARAPRACRRRRWPRPDARAPAPRPDRGRTETPGPPRRPARRASPGAASSAPRSTRRAASGSTSRQARSSCSPSSPPPFAFPSARRLSCSAASSDARPTSRERRSSATAVRASPPLALARSMAVSASRRRPSCHSRTSACAR